MLFKNFLEASHLRDGNFLSKRAMFNHVPIFFRHELLKSTGKFYIIKTHRNTSLYRGNNKPLPIGKIQLFATVQEFETERTGLNIHSGRGHGNKA
jgi:hypothetical protein